MTHKFIICSFKVKNKSSIVWCDGWLLRLSYQSLANDMNKENVCLSTKSLHHQGGGLLFALFVSLHCSCLFELAYFLCYDIVLTTTYFYSCIVHNMIVIWM